MPSASARHTPGELKVVNFAVTGSEANEIAMRMALADTGKYDIVSMIRGLHGGSLAVEALTSVGGNRRKDLGPLMFPAKSNALLPPYCYRCPVNQHLSRLRHRLPEVERGDAGVRHQPEHRRHHGRDHPRAGRHDRAAARSGCRGLPRMAKRWGALLILDECQLAPARTGKMWAMEHYGVTPDIVTWGKGLSAGLAICGTITTPGDRRAARAATPACHGPAPTPATRWSRPSP